MSRLAQDHPMRRFIALFLPACSVLVTCAAGASFTAARLDSPICPAEIQRVIGTVESVFTGLGHRNEAANNGPLLGNGDMGVCLIGSPDRMVFMLGKNDFWRLKHLPNQTSALGFGFLQVNIPSLKGAAVKLTQRLVDATLAGTLTGNEGASLRLTTYVAATENVLVVRLEATGKELPVELALQPDTFIYKQAAGTGADKGLMWATRSFTQDVDIITGASAALKGPGAEGSKFTLRSGQPVTLLIAMTSCFASTDHLTAAKQLAQSANADKLLASHRAWWAAFWGKSLVEVGDPELMRRYYMAQYVMGSASRNPDFPPGIIGPWITTNTRIPFAWGAYWMNYNFAAPFYGLYSSNHLEQADPQDTPILQFMPRGTKFAKDILHTRGFLYPVGIAPFGLDIVSSPHPKYPRAIEGGIAGTFGQRSNSAYNLVNMAQRWYTTYDPAYGRKIYPYVLGVVDFWEDYLTLEDDRYVINGEAVHEGSGKNKNPVSTLGFVRNTFRLALDMSRELDRDEDRRAKWRDILNRLSHYPTKEHNGKTIFILSEQGPVIWPSNDVHLQHIYPAGQIGLDSDSKLLEIARNTIEAYPRWYDLNASNSFFPAAARIGFNPQVIYNKMRSYPMQANGFVNNNPHGIENCSTIPNTVNEMLLQSHEGVLRFFPVWPRDKDARFVTLRAHGAFLVSAGLKNGVVTGVKIVSERGRDCTVQNPWPGIPVRVVRNGVVAEEWSGDRFTFPTKANEAIQFQTKGD